MASHKETYRRWLAYREQIHKETTVKLESPEAKQKRIQRLLDDPIEFIKYYFPHHVRKEPAKFHRRFGKEMKEVKRGILVKDWFRGSAKSSHAMMFLIYRKFIGVAKCVIYTSKTYDKACKLLSDLQAELMENQRIINDFGEQFSAGNWEEGEFKSKDGVAFFALGKGQSPRGLKDGANRPTDIIVDDIDDDEECRNSKRLDDSFEWLMGALFGCFGAEGGLFLVLNNIIAEDCLTQRVAKLVGAKVDTVHLTNAKGVSSWPEVWTKEAIEFARNSMPEYLFLREYYGQIIKMGKVWKREWIQFGKIPPLHLFGPRICTYTDPGFKNTKTADGKAIVLIGLYQGKWYIIKVFVGKDSVKTMISWHYEMYQYLTRHRAPAMMWMEEVFLQDLLFRDFAEEAKEYGYPVPVRGDTRKKPDKDARILATSFFFEKGNVIFNEEEKDNHHMQRLIDQYMMFQPGIKTPKDGIDAVEGGIKKIEAELINTEKPIYGAPKPNSKHKVV